VERVLPSEEVKKLIRGLAVGLAADCDSPERDVEKIMRENLAGAQRLPFVGLLTHDGKWVGGFAGYKDTPAFLQVLKAAEESPYLQASKAVRKKLAGLAASAQKAADKGDWKSVMRAAQAAAKTTGRCPERVTLAGIVTKARDWAAGQLDAAVRLARAGGDLAEPRKILGEVRKSFAGEPEFADADLGLKALKKLSQIVRLVQSGASPPAGIREKAARTYKGTRWESVFKPAEEPEEKGG
jgi:hypothetical protein